MKRSAVLSLLLGSLAVPPPLGAPATLTPTPPAATSTVGAQHAPAALLIQRIEADRRSK